VPLLSNVVGVLRNEQPSIEVVVARSANVDVAQLQPLVDAGARLSSDALGELRTSSAGLIKAGTSTLEATLCGLPFATFYRTSSLSYLISKHLANISSVTMMNLLLKRDLVHEFIQARATSQLLIQEVHSLLYDHQRREELKDAMKEVRSLLAGNGASSTAADIVVSMLSAR
jgi:lipid-A-disaccharide synthase